MPTNPYNPTGTHWSENHLIQGRVSQEDFFWFKHRFPYGCTGITDKVVATLLYKLINALRQVDRENPFDPAWSADHESYRILDDVLERITFMERRPTREYSIGGPVAAQHDSGRTDSVRAEVQPPPFIGPVEESKSKTRKRSRKGTKEKEKQRRAGDGVARKA